MLFLQFIYLFIYYFSQIFYNNNNNNNNNPQGSRPIGRKKKQTVELFKNRD